MESAGAISRACMLYLHGREGFRSAVEARLGIFALLHGTRRCGCLVSLGCFRGSSVMLLIDILMVLQGYGQRHTVTDQGDLGQPQKRMRVKQGSD